jgi:hypothetical protein
MSLDINLTNVQSKPIVVSANQTAENDRVYHVIANATFTDPTGVNGKGYIVIVRSGTATIAGNTKGEGTFNVRLFQSGSWTTYQYWNINLILNVAEVLSNKSTNVNTDQASNSKYPSVKAVFDWATNLLSNKVDAVAGKGLSENDFTNTLKTKLDGIEAGAEVNVNADWNATSGDAQILNKPTIPNASDFVAKSDFTAHSILAKQSGASDPVAVSIGNNEILGRKSGGGSNIEGLSVSEVKSLLNYTASDVGAPSGSGTSSGTNTGDETQSSILSKLGIFYLPFTPSSAVTGTTSETQVAVVTIPANTIRSIDNLRIYTPVVKSGTSGLCTVTYKLSTSATMPSGTTDRIAFVAGATGNLWIGMNRNASYNGGNLIIANSSTSLISDLTVAAQAPTVTARNNAVTLYLYISITLGNAVDSAYLSGGYITNN